MRFTTLIPALFAATAHLASASDATRTAAIYIQPLTAPSAPPSLLAELAIPDNDSPSRPKGEEQEEGEEGENPTTTTETSSSAAEVLSYSAPDLPEADDDETTTSQKQLVRIGIYDLSPNGGRWLSSTSVASADNFAKGYAPHFVVTLDGEGRYLGVVCRGVAIDAGQTRDFGPQAAVVRTEAGAQPLLGKPVVLSPEGRKVVEEVEKSFIQKYWWVLGIGAFLLVSGGGGEK